MAQVSTGEALNRAMVNVIDASEKAAAHPKEALISLVNITLKEVEAQLPVSFEAPMQFLDSLRKHAASERAAFEKAQEAKAGEGTGDAVGAKAEAGAKPSFSVNTFKLLPLPEKDAKAESKASEPNAITAITEAAAEAGPKQLADDKEASIIAGILARSPELKRLSELANGEAVLEGLRVCMAAHIVKTIGTTQTFTLQQGNIL